jgi:hypothetical protein
LRTLAAILAIGRDAHVERMRSVRGNRDEQDVSENLHATRFYTAAPRRDNARETRCTPQ